MHAHAHALRRVCACVRARARVQAYRRDPLLRLDEKVLEVEEDALVDVLVDERRGDARLAAAARATDAMDVVLDLLRHVEVDHVLPGVGLGLGVGLG